MAHFRHGSVNSWRAPGPCSKQWFLENNDHLYNFGPVLHGVECSVRVLELESGDG